MPMTADGPAPITTSTDLLSDAELAPMVAEAQARWEEALGNESLAESLVGVRVAIVDLPGDTLGVTLGNTILIDTNAAGYGWFIDLTPADDSEFTNGSTPSTMPVAIVPDFVHYNHRPHIAAGLNCETCHGDLAKETVYQNPQLMNMGWCLNCHRQKAANDPVKYAKLTDCGTCHY